MIRADMIPLEVSNAVSAARKNGVSSAEIAAAALNAWPGLEYKADAAFPAFGYGPAAIILPLPEEVRDE